MSVYNAPSRDHEDVKMPGPTGGFARHPLEQCNLFSNPLGRWERQWSHNQAVLLYILGIASDTGDMARRGAVHSTTNQFAAVALIEKILSKMPSECETCGSSACSKCMKVCGTARRCSGKFRTTRSTTRIGGKLSDEFVSSQRIETYLVMSDCSDARSATVTTHLYMYTYWYA